MIDWMNVVVPVWFLTSWVGYAYFAKAMAKRTHCLASVLHLHRIDWMRCLLRRDQRVSDAALLSNIERNVNFFASTTILVLAGILTLITNATHVFESISHIPFQAISSENEFLFKLICMVGIFVYAFFTFTWSLRQFNMASTLVGAAPLHTDLAGKDEEREKYAIFAGKIIDQAGHSYNYGLRSYYFSLAALSWFIDPWLCMGATSLVVGVLYQREFHSKTLRTLVKGLSEEG